MRQTDTMISGYKEVLHILIAAYVVLGWLLSPIIHGPFCIAVLVHWFLNKNRCMLSEGYEDNNGFTTGLLAKIGINIQENEWLKTIVPYILVSIPAAISIYMGLNTIDLGGGLAYNIGKYIAPIIPLALTGSSLFKSFANGIQEGQKQVAADNIFMDSGLATEPAPAPAPAANVA